MLWPKRVQSDWCIALAHLLFCKRSNYVSGFSNLCVAFRRMSHSSSVALQRGSSLVLLLWPFPYLLPLFTFIPWCFVSEFSAIYLTFCCQIAFSGYQLFLLQKTFQLQASSFSTNPSTAQLICKIDQNGSFKLEVDHWDSQEKTQSSTRRQDRCWS